MNVIELICSLPKSIYFNVKYFGIKDGIRLPILLSHNVKFIKLNGDIEILDKLKMGMIKIGFGNVGIFDKRRSKTLLELNGQIIFNGRADIGHGSKLCVNGILTIGNRFKITAESSIICYERITIGDDCIFSWENLIMDTDLHKVYDENNNYVNPNKEILIGNKVWVGCRCTILKGTTLTNGIVVAAGSLINKTFFDQNTVLAGNPAKVVKNDINWSY